MMVLMNPIAFRLNYTHNWKYRNIIAFDKANFSHLIRESYFLPHYLSKLFERKVFRRFECYFSHLVVHRLNSGKTYYNIFVSSRLFFGMFKWFRFTFMRKFYYRVYRNNGKSWVSVRALVKQYMALLSVKRSDNLVKALITKDKDGVIKSRRRVKLNYFEYANRSFQKIKNFLAKVRSLFNLISKFNKLFIRLYVKVLTIINSSLSSFKKAIKSYSNYKKEQAIVRLFTVHNKAPTANSLGSVFLHRLRRGSSINRLVNSTLERVKKKQYKYIKGIRIVCEGRFKRRQRAQHNVYNVGKVKTSSIRAKVDYSLTTSYLKYGAASVRIWLNYV